MAPVEQGIIQGLLSDTTASSTMRSPLDEPSGIYSLAFQLVQKVPRLIAHLCLLVKVFLKEKFLKQGCENLVENFRKEKACFIHKH